MLRICRILTLGLVVLWSTQSLGRLPESVDVEQESTQSFALDLPLVIDDNRVLGNLAVSLNTQGLLAVQADAWRRLTAEVIAQDVTQKLENRAQPDGLIPIDAFDEVGMAIIYDPASLTIILKPEDDQRTVQGLQQAGRAAEIALPDEGADHVGGFVNVRATQDVIWSGQQPGANRTDTVLGVDGGVRLFGVRGIALQGSAVYDTSTEDNNFLRGETRVIHDDPENAIRYSAGDIAFEPRRFQGAPPLLGLSAERRYDLLQPTRVVSSRSQRTFTLARPSRVEFIVNGQLREILQLRPGRFDISDFNFVDGVSDVTLVIEDNTGRRETLSFTLFTDGQLLERGLSQFSANVGFQRDDEATADIRYDFARPAFSVAARYGLTEALTLGAQSQGGDGLISAGAEAVVASNAGIFSAGTDFSHSDQQGSGLAAIAGWQYNLSLFGPPRSAQLDLTGIYASDDFRALGSEGPVSPFRWQALGRLGTPLPLDMAGSLSIGHSVARSPENDNETVVGLSLSRRFRAILANLRANFNSAEEERRQLFLSLTVPLGQPRNRLRFDYESLDDTYRAEWARIASNRVGDVAGRVLLETSQRGPAALAEASFFGNRFIAQGRHETTDVADDGEAVVNQSRFQIETGFGFVGKRLAMGRPVNEAFAIVSRHPSLGTAKLFVNEGNGGPAAIANDMGPALVPDLLSYRQDLVAWRGEGIPEGYDIGQTVREVTLPFIGSRAFLVGSDASFTVVGTAIGPDGTPLSYLAGMIYSVDDPDQAGIQTFTNKVGRFAASSLAPGAYRVEFASAPRTEVRFAVEEEREDRYIPLGQMAAAYIGDPTVADPIRLADMTGLDDLGPQQVRTNSSADLAPVGGADMPTISALISDHSWHFDEGRPVSAPVRLALRQDLETSASFWLPNPARSMAGPRADRRMPSRPKTRAATDITGKPSALDNSMTDKIVSRKRSFRLARAERTTLPGDASAPNRSSPRMNVKAHGGTNDTAPVAGSRLLGGLAVLFLLIAVSGALLIGRLRYGLFFRRRNGKGELAGGSVRLVYARHPSWRGRSFLRVGAADGLGTALRRATVSAS